MLLYPNDDETRTKRQLFLSVAKADSLSRVVDTVPAVKPSVGDGRRCRAFGRLGLRGGTLARGTGRLAGRDFIVTAAAGYQREEHECCQRADARDSGRRGSAKPRSPRPGALARPPRPVTGRFKRGEKDEKCQLQASACRHNRG